MAFKARRLRAVVLACVVSFGLATPTFASGPLFSTPVFPVGSSPRRVIPTDVNRDGKVDLVTSNAGFGPFEPSAPPSISVRLGDGEGGFGVEVRTPVGPDAYWIAAGEFNGDARLDLVVTGALSFDAVVLLGNGDGTFEEGAHFFPGDVFMPVAAEDFDEDGRLDLAFGRPFSCDIAVYLGGGDGSFVAGETLPGGGATDLAAADLDSDGNNDLIATEFCFGSAQTLAVHRGRGDGAFEPATRIEVDDGAGFLALGDLNGDGQKDAAVTSNLGGSVSIFLGMGEGSFALSTGLRVGTSPGAVAMGDLDHDGRMDLAVADNSVFVGSPETNDIFLLPGDGDGTFGEAVRVTVGTLPTFLTTADLDRDGDQDLAVVDSFLDSIAVLFNVGHTLLRRDLFLPTSLDPAGFAVGDINGDHHLDFAVLLPGNAFSSGSVRLMMGFGDGTFFPAGGFAEQNPYLVLVGDLNDDVLRDIVVANAGVCLPSPDPFEPCTLLSPSDVRVYLGEDGGNFTLSSRFDVGLGGPLAIEDLNGDGRLDLVAARSGPHFQVNGSVTVRLGNGDGTFGEAASFAVGPSPRSLVVADLDGDGFLDVVVGHAAPFVFSGVSILKGLGDGTLSAEERLGGDMGAVNVAVLDLDGDGNHDIAALTGTAPPTTLRLTLFPGLDAGGFGPGIELFRGRMGGGIEVGDFDNDGHEDLLVPEFARMAVVRGGAPLQPVEPLRFMASAGLALPGDFNEDGRLDVAQSTSGGITIMLNEGPFPNEPPVAVAAAEPRVECTSPAGAEVTLDGSGSSDPDSAPGTLDDIVAFDWFEDMGLASERLVGSGQILSATLSLGDHAIALRVTDSAGETAIDEIVVSVLDTTPPVVEAGVSPHLLWPPNHRMVPVEATVTAVDVCGQATTALESVTSDEEDDAAGPEDGKTRGDIQGAQVTTAGAALELRAERDGGGDGRVYTLTYIGTDESGNPARAAVMVVVPHDQSGVTDPVEVTAREGPAGTVLEWGAVAGAFYYNVVRGHVGRVRPEVDAIGLGELACIESRSLDATSAGHEDAQRPPPGEAYFYLVEYDDGWGSSFGSEGVGLPRVKQGGGCP